MHSVLARPTDRFPRPLAGFFAYSFFDDRSSIEKKEWIWPYIRESSAFRPFF